MTTECSWDVLEPNEEEEDDILTLCDEDKRMFFRSSPVIEIEDERVFVGVEAHKYSCFSDFLEYHQITHVVDLTHCLEPTTSTVCECAFYDLECFHTNDVRSVTVPIAIAQLRDIYTTVVHKVLRNSQNRILVLDDSDDMTYGFALAWAFANAICCKSPKSIRMAIRARSAEMAASVSDVLEFMHLIECRPGSAPPLVQLPPLRNRMRLSPI